VTQLSADVVERDIEYDADGRRMVGYLAAPSAGVGRPAVLLAHGGAGERRQPRARARRLAELGYVAFALDYHGGGRQLTHEETRARLPELGADVGRIRSLGQLGLDVLLAEEQVDRDRVAAIGYCFGGTVVLELARSGAPLAAVVGFHAILSTPRPEDAANIRGRVLACIGSEDPYVPPEQRRAFEEEMRAARVDWRLHLYGGAPHAFTDPNAGDHGLEGVAYDRRADERSWRDMLDLFDEALAPQTPGPS
jgi:dienelactone hydrolase